jgi:hypothetical protein
MGSKAGKRADSGKTVCDSLEKTKDVYHASQQTRSTAAHTPEATSGPPPLRDWNARLPMLTSRVGTCFFEPKPKPNRKKNKAPLSSYTNSLMPHHAQRPSVADLLAACKEASWHGVPEGVKLLLAAVEALLEDVTAQGAVLHALARGGPPAISSAASPHAIIGAMLQGSGSGSGEASWQGAPHVRTPASPAGKTEARSDQIGGREATVPAMMLMMMQEKLKAERAMRGDPTDGPRKELMELLERSPLDMTPEERLQGLASVIDGLE